MFFEFLKSEVQICDVHPISTSIFTVFKAITTIIGISFLSFFSFPHATDVGGSANSTSMYEYSVQSEVVRDAYLVTSSESHSFQFPPTFRSVNAFLLVTALREQCTMY